LIDDESLVDPSSTVHGVIGRKVVVGPGCHVECDLIEDSVILPGAQVTVSGIIRHAIIGGSVSFEGDVDSSILHGEYTE
jgi:ADP-glucose pyrophosphorylase